MKAILEFNLPEDDEDYEIITSAFKTKRLVDDFDQFLRNAIKYGNLKEEDIYQEIRDKLYDIASEIGVDIGL